MARQGSLLGAMPRAVTIAVVSWFCAVTSSALAAGEGELCGKGRGWSASCDPGLRCELRWSVGSSRLGVCTTDPSICGGLTGAACASGQFCDYPAGAQCGAADQTGSCRARPAGCTKEYRPVCGCDDRTYGNACAANAAGVSVRANGVCSSTSVVVSTCEYDDFTYELGENFIATDGCNSCLCATGGHVVCGVQCQCRGDDPNLAWVSHDPSACLRLEFQCQGGARPFLNQCGCGCLTRG